MKLDGQEIDKVLLGKISGHASRLNDTLDRREEGPITPNLEIVINSRRFRKLYQKRALAILSWWLGPVGFLLREDLRACSDWQVQISIAAKAGAVENLQVFYSERDFFGNLVPLMEKLASQLKVLNLQPRRAKRTIRHRGYRDHGSLRPSHQWAPKYDWSLTEEQNQIEEHRKSLSDTLEFLLGLSGII